MHFPESSSSSSCWCNKMMVGIGKIREKEKKKNVQTNNGTNKRKISTHKRSHIINDNNKCNLFLLSLAMPIYLCVRDDEATTVLIGMTINAQTFFLIPFWVV